MAVTYKTAAERDAIRRSHVGDSRLARVDRLEWLLAGVSMLAAILVVTTYLGVARVPRSAALDVPPLSLNGTVSAERLDSILERVFPLPADRRVAVQQLLSFIDTADGGRRTLANVGGLARARVPVAAIEHAPAAAAFRERVEQERERAKALGREALASVPLLTSAQLSAVKPFFVVRDNASMRSSLVIWTLVYILAFHGVSLVWRLKKIPGDRVLLIAAHLLTAVGLAAMISRPDPLRDLLLFPRYVEGIVAGLAVAAVLSIINIRTSSLKGLSYLPLAAAFTLSLLLLSPLGSGPSGSGAKVNLGPFQPIEAIRILLHCFWRGTSPATGNCCARCGATRWAPSTYRHGSISHAPGMPFRSSSASARRSHCSSANTISGPH